MALYFFLVSILRPSLGFDFLGLITIGNTIVVTALSALLALYVSKFNLVLALPEIVIFVEGFLLPNSLFCQVLLDLDFTFLLIHCHAFLCFCCFVLKTQFFHSLVFHCPDFK